MNSSRHQRRPPNVVIKASGDLVICGFSGGGPRNPPKRWVGRNSASVRNCLQECGAQLHRACLRFGRQDQGPPEIAYSPGAIRTLSGAGSRRSGVRLAVRKRPSQLLHPRISPYFPELNRPDIPIDRLAQANLKPGCPGCGKTPEVRRKIENWGIENHQPSLTDRSLGILTRSIFSPFSEIEFFRSLCSPETELPLSPAHVQTPSRLTVRLARVPNDPAFESGHRRDGRCQVKD